MIRVYLSLIIFLTSSPFVFSQDSINKKISDLKPIEPFHYHEHFFSNKNNITFFKVGNDTVLNLTPYLKQIPECIPQLRKANNARIAGISSFGLGIATLITFLSLKHDDERSQYRYVNLIPLCGMLYFPIIRKIHLKKAIKIYNEAVSR